MKHKQVILDSGAFTVWTKKITIDLDKYIEFCKQHPLITYYVNLDVIPGTPNDKRSVNKKSIEASAEAGWKNYQTMLKHLPIEKVIPVFHQNEDLKWVDKYLKFGTPYLGISPANDRTTEDKINWLKSIEKETNLCFTKGEPRIKTHGFAVTSLRLMKYWHWHSVDSVSWLKNAAFGSILVPPYFKDENYNKKPWSISFSMFSPEMKKRNQHYFSATPLFKKQIEKYVDALGFRMGETEKFVTTLDTELQKNEFWIENNKRAGKVRVSKLHKPFAIGQQEIVLQDGEGLAGRAVVKGLINWYRERCKVNIQFINKQEEALPVDHIYFAGCYNRYSKDMCNRLFSYYELKNGTENKIQKIFKKYEERIEYENKQR